MTSSFIVSFLLEFGYVLKFSIFDIKLHLIFPSAEYIEKSNKEHFLEYFNYLSIYVNTIINDIN